MVKGLQLIVQSSMAVSCLEVHWRVCQESPCNSCVKPATSMLLHPQQQLLSSFSLSILLLITSG